MKPESSIRIVSLLPSATEIINCLGLGEFLVGRSHECDYPSFVRDLPVCTEARLNSHQSSGEIDAEVQTLVEKALSIYKIQIEVLKQLQPTHIVTQDQCDVCAVNLPEVEKAMQSLMGETPKTALHQEEIASLTKSSPQVISLQPNLLNEIWQDIERVAKTLNVDAEPVLNKLQNRIKAISIKTQSIEPKPTVTALEWTEPLMGAGNWIPELIEIAGGRSLLGVKGKHSPYLSWENLLAADPDIIVIMPCGFDLERTEKESQVLSNYLDWGKLKAVKSDRVFIVDGNAYFNRPSQRLVDSAEILAEIFHPQLFDYGYRGKSWQKLC